MSNKEKSSFPDFNIHEGHRERMMEKLINFPDALSDHELLEVILYPIVLRKDTNPLAHNILHQFGSLKKVFSATIEELMTVRGVGEKTACQIIAMGKVFERIDKNKPKKVEWSSIAKEIKELEKLFYNDFTERFVLILLTNRYTYITKIEFESFSIKDVEAKIPEIVRCFAINKPEKALIAHNHPSKTLSFSDLDKLATKRLNLLCNIHGVNLLDHIIIGGGKYLSYFQQEDWWKLKEDTDPNKLMDYVSKAEQKEQKNITDNKKEN